ncbi:FGGY family carbohydrate kinase [Paenibacillaceae bacterium WGS1546]|uniref:FGGY family carbohydrate kinase n=1 Tax=Cohnella sp. WGS1546 TaxID=3366810 RepID=UPI00372D63AE
MNPQENPILAVDIGSTVIKAALYTIEGRRLASRKAPFPSLSAGDRTEIGTRELWLAFVELIRALCEGREQIAAIGMTSQMAGLILLDDEYEPIAPLIAGVDQRGTPYVSELLRRTVGMSVHSATGCPPLGIYPTAKLLGMAVERPESIRRARYIGGVKEFLLWKLTGKWVTDPASASSTQLFDQQNRQWWPEMLAAVGIPHVTLPQVAEADQVAGCLLPAASKELNIRQETIVFVGTGDGPGANLSTGAFRKDQLCLSLGTTAVVRYIHEVANWNMANSGYFRQWFGADIYLHGYRLDGAGKEIEAYLPRHGSAPDLNDNACSAVTSMYYNPMEPKPERRYIGDWSAANERDRLHAVLDGIAFALFRAIKPAVDSGIYREIRPVGGGVRNEAWMQRIAALFQLPLVFTDSEDNTLGAAAVMIKRIKSFPNWPDTVQSLVGIKRVLHPDARIVHQMKGRYDSFRKINERGDSI